MNTALICLIFKNKGDRSDLKNWRPISLLNVDYKIIAKALTNRLQKIMPEIIQEEQTCGVKGRNIHDNLMILRDTVDYVNNENIQTAMLSIDQEKAFYRIEWNYLYSVMEKMGIPVELIKWIKIMYSNPVSAIIVNNFITEPFSVTRGIRQGWSLSPLLYTICAEGLACLIRTNKTIKGIRLPGTVECQKLIQHADDTTIFITENKDFEALESIFQIYSEGSGSKINKEKSHGLWLGKWKNRKDKPGGLNWENQSLKILGIVFGNEDNSSQNWEPRINKMKGVLNRWKGRNLTMKGKSVIVNSLIGAGLSYFGTTLSCPEEYIQKMQNIILNFYWNDKPHKRTQ